jgi:hypothetical protein
MFQNTEERKVGVYVRAHPTIELLEDRLYLGKSFLSEKIYKIKQSKVKNIFEGKKKSSSFCKKIWEFASKKIAFLGAI